MYDHSKQTYDHSKLSYDHSKLLNNHSKLLNDHSKLLYDHSKKTYDHSERSGGSTNQPKEGDGIQWAHVWCYPPPYTNPFLVLFFHHHSAIIFDHGVQSLSLAKSVKQSVVTGHPQIQPVHQQSASSSNFHTESHNNPNFSQCISLSTPETTPGPLATTARLLTCRGPPQAWLLPPSLRSGVRPFTLPQLAAAGPTRSGETAGCTGSYGGEQAGGCGGGQTTSPHIHAGEGGKEGWGKQTNDEVCCVLACTTLLDMASWQNRNKYFPLFVRSVSCTWPVYILDWVRDRYNYY